jgi:hypothetical protein
LVRELIDNGITSPDIGYYGDAVQQFLVRGMRSSLEDYIADHTGGLSKYLGWPGDDTRLLAARWLTYAWTGDADNFRYPEGYVAGLEAEEYAIRRAIADLAPADAIKLLSFLLCGVVMAESDDTEEGERWIAKTAERLPARYQEAMAIARRRGEQFLAAERARHSGAA